MLLRPSIGPKKWLIGSKKKFWISIFFAPKTAKNLVLGALIPGAEWACAPTAPAQIFVVSAPQELNEQHIQNPEPTFSVFRRKLKKSKILKFAFGFCLLKA